jgi:hypothetical protein
MNYSIGFVWKKRANASGINTGRSIDALLKVAADSE